MQTKNQGPTDTLYEIYKLLFYIVILFAVLAAAAGIAFNSLAILGGTGTFVAVFWYHYRKHKIFRLLFPSS